MLNDEVITAVVIAVPSPLHYSFGKQVLLSGKDLYVEKPMTLKLNDADDLVEIAENNKRILMVCKQDIVACQAHPTLFKIGLVLARLFHFNSLVHLCTD